jgi:AcrR family transcriptional regulator
MPYARPKDRTDGDKRRQHFLDVAGAIIAESGAHALTMERLAARAGVSRALPYRYFKNSGEVLACLLETEWAWVDKEIARRLPGARALEEKALAALQPYLDALKRRGPAFPLLMYERSPLEPLRTMQRQRLSDMSAFWTDLVVSDLEIPRTTAVIAAGIMLSASDGAFRMVWLAKMNRQLVERMFTLVIRGAINELLSPSRSYALLQEEVSGAAERRLAAKKAEK